MQSTVVPVYYDGSSEIPVSVVISGKRLVLYNTSSFTPVVKLRLSSLMITDKEDSHVVVAVKGRFFTNKLILPPQHYLVAEIDNLNRFPGSLSLHNGWKTLGWFAGVAVILFLAYVGFMKLVTQAGTALLSRSKEREIGELMRTKMLEDKMVDSISTLYVQNFADQLQLSTHYPITVTVTMEPDVNAFALPGGYIVIELGILRKMKEPEELVALLGHEATHINERHTLKSMIQQLTGYALLSFIIGDAGSLSGLLVSNINNLTNLSYSRGLEEESDNKGMAIMLRNKVNPSGMVLLMKHLKEVEDANKGTDLPGFLSTHPLTSDRIQNAEIFLKKHPLHTPVPSELTKNWNLLKEEIKTPEAD